MDLRVPCRVKGRAAEAQIRWTTLRLLFFLSIASLIWFGARFLSRRLAGGPRSIVLLVIAALVLAALNSVNLCTPGWCAWYGFPLPYYTWSDAMLELNGARSGYPTRHVLAVLLDIAVVVFICTAVFRRVRTGSDI